MVWIWRPSLANATRRMRGALHSARIALPRSLSTRQLLPTSPTSATLIVKGGVLAPGMGASPAPSIRIAVRVNCRSFAAVDRMQNVKEKFMVPTRPGAAS